jgi:CMP/dCMP kinase
MKITISGAIGSGKSTVSRLLAEKLKCNYYSVGQIMRELAKERGISLLELAKVAENDSTIDKALDKKQKEIGKKDANFIMDSRLGFHFLPDSCKIFLDVNIKEAAKRIFNENRADEGYKSLDDAINFIKKRSQSEKKRYKEYYGIVFPDKKLFDIWIDTTSKSPSEIVQEIIIKLKHYQT